MKESALEGDCKKLALRYGGWIAYKGFGRNGAPDQIFTRGRIVFFVEFKKPNVPKRQRRAQVEEQAILEANESRYYLCNDLEEFRQVLIKENDGYDTLSK